MTNIVLNVATVKIYVAQFDHWYKKEEQCHFSDDALLFYFFILEARN